MERESTCHNLAYASLSSVHHRLCRLVVMVRLLDQVLEQLSPEGWLLCVHTSQFMPSSTPVSWEKNITLEAKQQPAKQQFVVVVGLMVVGMVVVGLDID